MEQVWCKSKLDIFYLAWRDSVLKNRMVKAASVNSEAQMASSRVAYRPAQCKIPHTIAEQLILPAALDMVSVMLNETSAAKLKAVPLSNDTVVRRICNIPSDLEEQLVEKLQERHFALQVGEATDAIQTACSSHTYGLHQMRTVHTVSFTGKRSCQGSSALN